MDMVPTPDGNFVLTGYSENTNFNFDPQIMKFDGNGNILWTKRLYQIGWQEYGYDILFDSQNNIVVAGNYSLTSTRGNFVTVLDSAGALLIALQFQGTSGIMGSYYTPNGQHLVEYPGFGYVYGTSLTQNINDHYQTIISADYGGNFSCSTAVNTYPFSIQDINWTPTNFANLPTATTAITGVPVTFTSSTATGTQFDICNLLNINEPHADISDKLYPNPVNDYLYIPVDADNIMYNVNIYDGHGKLVFSNDENSQHNNMKLNTSLLPPGFYMLQILDGKNIYLGRFMKME